MGNTHETPKSYENLSLQATEKVEEVISSTSDHPAQRISPSASRQRATNSQSEDNYQEDDDLMQAVLRIQRQAAFSAATSPWCYNTSSHITPSLLFGLQGMKFS